MTDRTNISSDPVAAHIDTLRREIDGYLADLVDTRSPSSLYDPVVEVLGSRGKRLRPLLTLLTAEAFGASLMETMPAAASVEVFHNFTLVHDDIMDHSATRRGRPSVHAAWGVPAGILAGDFLLALSYRLLAELHDQARKPALLNFSDMVVRLCEGQALDAEFELLTDVAVGDYLDMIARKTGALLVTSLQLGGIVAGTSVDRLELLGRVGHHLGIAFQIQDDLLDLTADPGEWGKPIGNDLVAGKRTFLILTAVEVESRNGSAWFRSLMETGGLDPSRIDEAHTRLDELGVLETAKNAILYEYAQALEALALLEADVDLIGVRRIIEQMRTRVR